MKKVGEKIRSLRLQNQWTQEYVANQLCMSVPAVSKLEMGITDVNFSRLKQISKFFGLTVIELLDVDDSLKQQNRTELEVLTLRLQERDHEVMKLQKKIIDLFEELNSCR